MLQVDDRAHLGLLSDVLGALAAGDSLESLLQPCAQAVVDRLGAAFARIWLLEGDELLLHASAGLYTHRDGAHGRIPLGAYKIGRIGASKTPHLTNDVLNDAHVSDKEWARSEGMVAFAGYPLLVESELVGVLGLFARHPLPDTTLDVLASVADSLALGVVRKQADDELRQERQIIDALHEVGAALARELHLEHVLQLVTDAATQLTGAEFGAFFYNVVDDGGESYVLYTLSGAPVTAFEGFGLPRNTDVFAPTFRGEATVRSSDITADPRYGRSAPHFGMPAGHPPVRSYLAVPVISRSGEVLGGLFFGHPEPGQFDARDERIVEGVASHAAVAVENARLYERERSAAITLQRSLLPSSLPSIPGVSLASMYLPASNFAEIGGDWYDALLLPDGALAITVGDVGGHDLQAAAAMGQLRNAVRMAALQTEGPAATLAQLDAYVSVSGMEQFATVLAARYLPTSRSIRMATAGHPPPIRIDPSGNVVHLAVNPMPAVGFGLVASPAASGEITVEMPPGTRMLFFTDGLVERRDRSWAHGIERLLAAAASGDRLEPAAFLKHLVEEMVGDSHQADDIALLLITAD